MSELSDLEWTAGFDEIGEILGKALPPSASEHRTWWANHGGQMVHQQAWLDAGWRVENVDLSRRQVVFRRMRLGRHVGGWSVPGNGANDHRPNDGLSVELRKAVEQSRQPASVSIRVDWTDVGVARRTEHGWALPQAPEGPALCRIHTVCDEKHTATIAVVRDLPEFLATVFAECRAGKVAPGVAAVCERLGAARYVAIDAVLPGQAWIVVDGRGSRASLDNAIERAMVERSVAMVARNAGIAVTRLKAEIA
ncbi:MAG: hypothetical protein C0606_07265 [Hyphomicrobiales bacterium]|nr:MAG: hypothetical protein C0606_07265 [Hyphomicrobiales bacterium]